MFNDKYKLTELVLSGGKTQTRRVVVFNNKTYRKAWSDKFWSPEVPFKDCLLKHSPYKIGEVVAVAQSYRDISNEMFGFATKVSGKEYRVGWGNKMYVKSELMLHHIRITNIRVEKLQDISDEDCLKEGISTYQDEQSSIRYSNIEAEFDTTQAAYADLIDKVSGKGTWESNPWVFVYDFELVN